MNISNFYTPIFQIFPLQMIHYDQNRYAQGEAYTVILWKTLSRLLKRNELIFPKRKRLKKYVVRNVIQVSERIINFYFENQSTILKTFSAQRSWERERIGSVLHSHFCKFLLRLQEMRYLVNKVVGQ